MRTSKLASNTTYPFICSFNGSGTSANVGLKANALLKQFVTAQIGVTAAALFQDDFINYKDGFMHGNYVEYIRKYYYVFLII